MAFIPDENMVLTSERSETGTIIFPEGMNAISRENECRIYLAIVNNIMNVHLLIVS